MLKTLIISICLGAGAQTGQLRDACVKSLEAASIQTGTADHFDQLKVYMEKQANKQMTDPIVRDGLAMAYVLTVKKEITFQTCVVPFVDQTEIHGTPKSGSVNFTWRF